MGIYQLKCEIIKKIKDEIKRSKIQKDHGIHAGTLSKWLKSADKIEGKVNKSTDKIVDKVNGEIQPVPEEDTENSQHKKIILILIINLINVIIVIKDLRKYIIDR